MRIVIALVSECKDKQIKSLVAEQVKRISKFAKVEFVEFKKGEKLGHIKEKYKNFYIFALCEKGKEYSSLKFAEKLEAVQNYNSSNILFVVSDADGFTKDEVVYADEVLSLSKMTFAHELSLFVLAEQVYRALSILNNHPYHRE